MNNTTAALSAGTEVEHRPGCICRDRESSAIMLDERAAILSTLAKAAGLEVVMVDNLKSDAIVLTRYGLLLVNPVAIAERAERVLDFVATSEDRQAGR